MPFPAYDLTPAVREDVHEVAPAQNSVAAQVMNGVNTSAVSEVDHQQVSACSHLSMPLQTTLSYATEQDSINAPSTSGIIRQQAITDFDAHLPHHLQTNAFDHSYQGDFVSTPSRSGDNPEQAMTRSRAYLPPPMEMAGCNYLPQQHFIVAPSAPGGISISQHEVSGCYMDLPVPVSMAASKIPLLQSSTRAPAPEDTAGAINVKLHDRVLEATLAINQRIDAELSEGEDCFHCICRISFAHLSAAHAKTLLVPPTLGPRGSKYSLSSVYLHFFNLLTFHPEAFLALRRDTRPPLPPKCTKGGPCPQGYSTCHHHHGQFCHKPLDTCELAYKWKDQQSV